jgi:hypothetical protein
MGDVSDGWSFEVRSTPTRLLLIQTRRAATEKAICNGIDKLGNVRRYNVIYASKLAIGAKH